MEQKIPGPEYEWVYDKSTHTGEMIEVIKPSAPDACNHVPVWEFTEDTKRDWVCAKCKAELKATWSAR